MTTNNTRLTADQIAIIDAIAANRLGDPITRMRAKIVQDKLIQAAEAGEDGGLYHRWAARIAAPLLRVRQ
jgi:chromosome condensin MukBEF complex kleisin-like MukF subunit